MILFTPENSDYGLLAYATGPSFLKECMTEMIGETWEITCCILESFLLTNVICLYKKIHRLSIRGVQVRTNWSDDSLRRDSFGSISIMHSRTEVLEERSTQELDMNVDIPYDQAIYLAFSVPYTIFEMIYIHLGGGSDCVQT